MAGISLATASRALSDPDMVHPDTRARVEEAVAKLGYVPHGAARALASRRSKTVAAVIPTLDNPIFSSSIQALQQRLTKDGFTLLLGSHEYDLAAEVRVVAALIERGIDGLVLVGNDHDPALYRLLANAAIPFELTWTLDHAGFNHCVGFSNRDAAAQVALHLVELGHRRVAMVSGYTESNDRARERVAGVRATLKAHGFPLASDWLVETAFSLRHGREALSRLLAMQQDFTAVVCGNDILALGVLIEAAARGVRVPDELSVTGFDDVDMAGQWTPALSTVRLPAARIGMRAAERMLARIGGVDIPRVEEVEVTFVARASTGPAR